MPTTASKAALLFVSLSLAYEARATGAGDPPSGAFLDQSFVTGEGLGASISECCTFVAQTFTAEVGGTLAAVRVSIQNSAWDPSQPGLFPLRVAIHSVESGFPTWNVLGSTTLSTSSSLLDQVITFAETIPMVAGVQYAIVASYPGAPLSNQQGTWMGAGGDPYPRGQFLLFYDPDWYYDGAGYDLMFQTYVTPCPTCHVNSAPVITCAGDFVAECGAPSGGAPRLAVGLSDADADPLRITWTIDGDVVDRRDLAAGTTSDSYSQTLALGPHVVRATVEDGHGGSASCVNTATIVDTVAPTVTAQVNKAMLWPPGGALVNVGLSVSDADTCERNPRLGVTVYSNEPDRRESAHDGGRRHRECGDADDDEDDDRASGDDRLWDDTGLDATDIAPGTLRLRAERAGSGHGRVYLIRASAIDQGDGIGRDCASVIVPHDQSRASLASLRQQATTAVAWCKEHGTAPAGFTQVGRPARAPFQLIAARYGGPTLSYSISRVDTQTGVLTEVASSHRFAGYSQPVFGADGFTLYVGGAPVENGSVGQLASWDLAASPDSTNATMGNVALVPCGTTSVGELIALAGNDVVRLSGAQPDSTITTLGQLGAYATDCRVDRRHGVLYANGIGLPPPAPPGGEGGGEGEEGGEGGGGGNPEWSWAPFLYSFDLRTNTTAAPIQLAPASDNPWAFTLAGVTHRGAPVQIERLADGAYVVLRMIVDGNATTLGTIAGLTQLRASTFDQATGTVYALGDDLVMYTFSLRTLLTTQAPFGGTPGPVFTLAAY